MIARARLLALKLREREVACLVVAATQCLSAGAELIDWPTSAPHLAVVAGPPLPAIRLLVASLIGGCALGSALLCGPPSQPPCVVNALVAASAGGGAFLVSMSAWIQYSVGPFRAVFSPHGAPLLCCATLAILANSATARKRSPAANAAKPLPGGRTTARDGVQLTAASFAVIDSVASLSGPASTGHLFSIDVAGSYWVDFTLSGALLLIVATAWTSCRRQALSARSLPLAVGAVATLAVTWTLRDVMVGDGVTRVEILNRLATRGAMYLVLIALALQAHLRHPGSAE